MKLLKSENKQGFFRNAQGEFVTIDKITKDDLLLLANQALDEDEAQFDEYNADNIKNYAHQIIYKNVYEKLLSLKQRRQEFKDDSKRLFLDAYEKYRGVSN